MALTRVEAIFDGVAFLAWEGEPTPFVVPEGCVCRGDRVGPRPNTERRELGSRNRRLEEEAVVRHRAVERLSQTCLQERFLPAHERVHRCWVLLVVCHAGY